MNRNTCVALVLLLFVLTQCSQKETPADLIIKGGTIYTVESENPTVEAVAVRADTIVYAGNLAGLSVYEGKNTTVIDLAGKTMTPGFIEGHGHFMGLGYSELNLDLMSVTSYEEMVEKVKEAVAKAQPGQWIIGRGWHQDKWTKKPEKQIKGFQTHHLLSEASPDNPVFLSHASGHAGFANAKAMQLAGVNQLSVEKLSRNLGEGGEILLDELGNPTGLFNERAQYLITQHIPDNTAETDAQALELAIAASLRNGITSFHDAGVSRDNIELYRKFKAAGKLNTRLYVMLTGFDSNLLYEWFKKGPEIDTANLLTIRAVKLNCDGALGSRGAWLLEPYSDRPDFSGMATLSMDTVLKISREGLKHGFQICSHAIGDRANKEILDRYEQAFSENPGKTNHRYRIEHAQHLHPNDIARFGKLGVIPAMQAIHLSSDRPWAIERLGEKRIKEGAYMWQSLLKSGAVIVNGTDVPVEPINPIASFFASVTRQTLKGEPVGGFEPDEKMARGQALRSYTLDAAYGAFEEKKKGSIKPGKLADFVVFSKDLMTIPDSEILSTEVVLTILGGKVLYEKK
ncbi:MAG TPA: amidohydrolase family protein [Cyclobacteriaceae bacterium]|nr:amidohydrolase family protein [Cyclobacteriaceae bacterium]HNU41623.1 amidohydrolase family protein [Cyclobacteriaceae bacterium]